MKSRYLSSRSYLLQGKGLTQSQVELAGTIVFKLCYNLFAFVLSIIGGLTLREERPPRDRLHQGEGLQPGNYVRVKL